MQQCLHELNNTAFVESSEGELELRSSEGEREGERAGWCCALLAGGHGYRGREPVFKRDDGFATGECSACVVFEKVDGSTHIMHPGSCRWFFFASANTFKPAPRVPEQQLTAESS